MANEQGFFSAEEMNAQKAQAQQNFVPAEQRKQYIVGIVLGALGFVAAFFIPIIGLVLSIVGMVLTNKHKDSHLTKVATIVCVLGILSGIGNWIYGIIVVAPQMMEQMQNAANAANAG
ncbi:MAG: hypothetical protein J6N70_03540 [Oribacterium sp.]|nr:hypothetical protein [Oribacterium sp.]MBQ5330745.1 hypothetical protein [Oscillospiraceae bacterium]